MGKEQGSKTVSMSSHPYRLKQSSPEQRLHSGNAARREACMNHQSYLRREEYLPPTQHGYPTYPNIYGTALGPADNATASTLNKGQRREAPFVHGHDNHIHIQNYYMSDSPAHYQPDRFTGSGMVQGNLAYRPAKTIVSRGRVDDMPPLPPPRQAGGSTTANRHTTQYGETAFSYVMPPKQVHTTQYGETAFSYVMPPKQQNLEFHSTDDEGPCDTERKRHAYQRYLYDLTGKSRKLMPAGPKKQPGNKSTAVSPGHHGGVMGTARRSRLCESESESESESEDSD